MKYSHAMELIWTDYQGVHFTVQGPPNALATATNDVWRNWSKVSEEQWINALNSHLPNATDNTEQAVENFTN